MRPAPLRPTAVAVIVVRGTGAAARVLVLTRRGGAFAGARNLVTGMIEAGESAPAAALRELHEETSIVPLALYTAERLDLFYDPIADAVQVVPIFVALAAADAAVVLDGSHEAYAWCTFAEAAAILEFAIHRDAVTHAERTIVATPPAAWRRLR
jgi:8-oxo-dGTP pyrophosphatase MutT (NUDIX family)